MGRLIFRAFQCEMELEYITVSRLLLAVAILSGAWVGHAPPDFCLAPPVFFVISRSSSFG